MMKFDLLHLLFLAGGLVIGFIVGSTFGKDTTYNMKKNRDTTIAKRGWFKRRNGKS